jgi:uncharacterized SAM-binding protein YcdF (DUF218 family)
MKAIGESLGIPPDLMLLEPEATSSVENARFSARIMQQRGWRSGLVVSDPSHLRYCIPVFRDAFEAARVDLYWTPVDYELLEALDLGRHPFAPPS